MNMTTARSKKLKRAEAHPRGAAKSSTPLFAENSVASDRVMKRVLSSKKNSIAFLVKVGILDKGGKGLAKPYR